jgi:glycosyltransferase involved in cell wall biosynthesis
MDALSVGMERRAKISSFFLAKLFFEESKRLKFYERKILNYFESSIIISEQDKNLILCPKEKPLIIIPNGVSADFLNSELKIEKKYDIVFVGNLSYIPNIESCMYIAKKIIPLLKVQFPTVKILFSGADPSSKIVALRNENIFVQAWVDDIKTSYLSAKIFFAPMLSGTGMQNKILEAMALGIPVVTSTLANNAILAEKEIEILIADTKTDFIEKLSFLLNDEEKITLIGKNGKEFIRSNYSWEKSNKKLLELFAN